MDEKEQNLDSAPWIWRSVSTISIVATLLLIFGFGYAIKDVIFPQGDAALSEGQKVATPAQDTQNGGNKAIVEDGKIRMAVIGDSLQEAQGTMKDLDSFGGQPTCSKSRVTMYKFLTIWV